MTGLQDTRDNRVGLVPGLLGLFRKPDDSRERGTLHNNSVRRHTLSMSPVHSDSNAFDSKLPASGISNFKNAWLRDDLISTGDFLIRREQPCDRGLSGDAIGQSFDTSMFLPSAISDKNSKKRRKEG